MLDNESLKLAKHYSVKLREPVGDRQGLANALQRVINLLGAGDSQEAIFQLVDLVDSVSSRGCRFAWNISRKPKAVRVVYRQRRGALRVAVCRRSG